MKWFKKKSDVDKNGFIHFEIKHLVEWDEPNGEGCIVSGRKIVFLS